MALTVEDNATHCSKGAPRKKHVHGPVLADKSKSSQDRAARASRKDGFKQATLSFARIPVSKAPEVPSSVPPGDPEDITVVPDTEDNNNANGDHSSNEPVPPLEPLKPAAAGSSSASDDWTYDPDGRDHEESDEEIEDLIHESDERAEAADPTTASSSPPDWEALRKSLGDILAKEKKKHYLRYSEVSIIALVTMTTV